MPIFLITIWSFLKPYKHYLIPLAVLCLAVAIVLLARGCGGKREVRIDEQKLEQINSANEAKREQALDELFAEIDTEREIDDVERKQIEVRVEKAKQQGKNVTASELEALLEETRK